MNKIIFENGISHILSDDEMKILKSAISFLVYCDSICSDVEQRTHNVSLENLKIVFLDHLD